MLATAVAAAHVDGSTELHEPLGSGQAQGVWQGGARCRKERVVRRSAKRRLNEAAGRVMGGTALEHEGRALICEYRQLLAAQTDAAPCLNKKFCRLAAAATHTGAGGGTPIHVGPAGQAGALQLAERGLR